MMPMINFLKPRWYFYSHATRWEMACLYMLAILDRKWQTYCDHRDR